MPLDPRELCTGPVVEPRWLDVDDAARYLCLSVHAIYHRVSRRQIPFVKHRRMIRFDRFALDRRMAKGVRHGFDETRRPLVLQEDDQRPALRRNRDAQIVAHFLPHSGAKRLDEITKSDIVRYLNFRRAQKTASPGHKTRRQILGHSSVAVTEAHYAHLLKDDLVAVSRQVRLPIAKRNSDNVLSMPPRWEAQK
jgi:hypothetical protein